MEDNTIEFKMECDKPITLGQLIGNISIDTDVG